MLEATIGNGVIVYSLVFTAVVHLLGLISLVARMNKK